MKEPLKDDRLALEMRKAAIQRLRQRFAHLPAGVSLADELIAERRAAGTAVDRKV
jgi:hypothetical protein